MVLPDPVMFLFGEVVPLRVVFLLAIGLFMFLIFSMAVWPDFWRGFLMKTDGKEKKGIPTVAWIVLLIVVFVIGGMIASVLTFRNTLNNIPENVMVQKCTEYSEGCVPVDCSNLMKDSNPYIVCKTCGEGLSQVIRIEVPVVKSPI